MLFIFTEIRIKKLTFTKGNHPENIKKKLQRGSALFWISNSIFISNVNNKNRRDVIDKRKESDSEQ